MTCEETRELLSPYLDSRLSPCEAQAVAAHLRSCPSCRQEADELRLASQLVASLPAPTLQVDLASLVVARACAPTWGERWASFRESIAPGQAFVARQWSRAAAIVVLFVIAAAGGAPAQRALILAWPGRVANAANAGAQYMSVTIARAQVFLDEAATAPARLESTPRKEPERRAPARQKSPNAANEVSSHVIA